MYFVLLMILEGLGLLCPYALMTTHAHTNLRNFLIALLNGVENIVVAPGCSRIK